jgi:hypothetical protein
LGEALTQAMQAHFPNNVTLTGDHYFNDNGQPVWDLTHIGLFAGNQGAFVVAKKDEDIPSPDNAASDIDWLKLDAISGALATQIYRINTAGGQQGGPVRSSVDWCLSCSINVILLSIV